MPATEKCSSLYFLARIGQLKWCWMNPIALAGQRKAFELLAREYALRAGGQADPQNWFRRKLLELARSWLHQEGGHEGKLTILS